MKDIICDMHVHSKYSCDSNEELEEYCLSAIQKGLYTICFTEHVDHNVNDYGNGYYNAQDFFCTFQYLKEKYKSKINLLCGIEFSEPHIYHDKYLEYIKLPYDYILGSIHFWYKDLFPTKMIKEGISAEICYEHYWNELLSAINIGGFDALAHIDFPKRYYNKLIVDHNKLSEICYKMVKNNIVLEINTSSLRKNIPEAMPDKEILSIYKSCGGKYITIGSDAHNINELSADCEYAKKLIDYYNLEEVIFIQRKMVSINKRNFYCIVIIIFLIFFSPDFFMFTEFNTICHSH
jgi:histidinol-phosphatase (PHP family)